MGAWGISTFENDGALDWIGDFLESPSESRIIQTFAPQARSTKTGFFAKLFGARSTPLVEEFEGEEVLAAAEVVAIMKGQPPSQIPEDLEGLPVIRISKETVALAIRAIDSVLDSSNLKDCWEETDEYSSWRDTVLDIRRRLSLA